MALGDADCDGSAQEEGRSREPDVIARGSALECFTEGPETSSLIRNLRGVCGDLVARETAVEKFLGEGGCPSPSPIPFPEAASRARSAGRVAQGA